MNLSQETKRIEHGLQCPECSIIEYVHINDDGVSQEFSCAVLSVKEFAK